MKKLKAKPGDIFAVPLDSDGLSFGYVRTYNDPDIAIIPIVSEKRILKLGDITNTKSALDAFSLRKSIESRKWPLIGNIPFESVESAWPPPMKQVSKIRPDIRLVVFKGHFISEEKFGAYDDLPEFIKLKDEDVIQKILEKIGEFEHV